MEQSNGHLTYKLINQSGKQSITTTECIFLPELLNDHAVEM